MSKRKEYRDMIEKYGKKYLTLLEMKKVNFHPKVESALEVYEKHKNEISELNEEISKIQNQINIPVTIEDIKKEITDRRKAQSKEHRLKLREERIRKAEERRKIWANKLKTTVVSVGRFYSYDINEKESNMDRQVEFNVPELASLSDLLELLEIDLSKLKFLTFHRDAAKYSHYYYFEIPKKSGGYRQISAPKEELNKVQDIIHRKILKYVPISDSAHGFREGQSILTNATEHFIDEPNKNHVIVNMDLKDFFPSILYPRIQGMFRNTLGYSGEIATFLAMLCSEPQRVEISVKGEKYFVAKDMRHLPQGAPTSPMITNIMCWNLDRRLQGLASHYGFKYTRYADDITFSGLDDTKIGKIIGSTRFIVKDEGFSVNSKKTRVLRYNRRQAVTGIVVNEIISPPKRWIKLLRAELHQIAKKLENNATEVDDAILHHLSVVSGKVSYLRMVNPSKGNKFEQELKKIQSLLF